VIGVMPPSFVFPLTGMNEGKPADMFVPMGFTPNEMSDVGDNFSYGVIGRMKTDVSIEAASADVARIAHAILQTYPPQDRDKIQLTAATFPLREQVVGQAQTSLLLLFGAVGFVLLIACANVANLLLAHATNRQKEFAVRMAMGADRARLVRQLAVETGVLAVTGGAAGLGLAVWLTEILAKLLPIEIPRIHPVEVDGVVLVFTCGLAAFTGIAFGIVPALIASRVDLTASMKQTGSSTGTGVRNRRMRAGLAVIEVALSVVLLAGSALLVRSLFRVLETTSGFEPEHVIAASLYLPPAKYERDNQVRSFYRDLLERLKQSPGVTDEGASTDLPLEGGWNHVFTAEGKNSAAGGDLPIAFHSIILGDYLQTMGIRLLQGRYFDASDSANAPPVLIVSESLAKRYWPNESPLGKRLKWGPAVSSDPWMTVVGVVSDVKQRELEAATLPHTYEPYEQHKGAPNSLNVAMRTQTDAEASAAELRDAVWGIDQQLAVAQLRTMDEVINESTSGRRFNLSLVGAFTLLAVLLTAIGVYGVIGCSVAERTHEIGIRMALGATKGDVMTKVVKEGLLLALGGIGIGLAVTLMLARVVAGLLYGISGTDPLTLIAVCMTIAAVCVAASYLPARAAMRVDPMVALRHE
jgi:predicted permease